MTYDELHQIRLEWEGEPEAEADRLIRDLVSVEVSAHQTMVIVGPWFETRVAHIVRGWLPPGWMVSGPAQVFDVQRPGLRSRSWDIIVHREGLLGLPPEAAPGAGFPVVPKNAVAAVIDTKTFFSTPRKYAAKPIFNLANEATEPQGDFLGPQISQVLLIGRSGRSAASLSAEGRSVGLETFCLATMRSRIDAGLRTSVCKLASATAGESALERFRECILEAIYVRGG